MKRRQWLGAAVGGWVIAGAPWLKADAVKASEVGDVDPRPDILFIVLDDFGHGYLAANFAGLGASGVTPALLARDAGRYDTGVMLAAMAEAMPTLNHLAANGLRLSNAYATASLCAPARSALLTGRHNANFGIYTNEDATLGHMPAGSSYAYPVDALRQSGYNTAAVGKWHARQKRWQTASVDDPLSCGFSSFYGFNHHGTNYYRSALIHQSTEAGQYVQVPQPEGAFLIDQFTQAALDALNRTPDASAPTFLYLAYNAVHGPLLTRDQAPTVYRFARTRSAAGDLLLSYMRAVDAGVAQLLALQRARGRESNTLLLFVSDNGSPGVNAYPAPANSPAEGFKGQQMQGGLRVPMLAHWPAQIAAGLHYTGLASAMDLMPTALQAAGLGVEGLEGIPLQRLFAGDWPAQDQHHSALFFAGLNAGNWGLPNQPRESLTTSPGGWMVRTPTHSLTFTAADAYLVPGSQTRGQPRRSLFAADDLLQVNDLMGSASALAAATEAQFWAWFAGKPEPVATAGSRYWQDLLAAAPPGAKQHGRLGAAPLGHRAVEPFDPRRAPTCQALSAATGA